MRWWLVAKILLHPLRYVQDRIDAFVMARVKRQPGPIQVPRYRVYIVPTSYGYGFALMVFVMLLGAMNYSNSMAYALVFLLTALGLVCMHHTHGNLVNTSVRGLRVRPVFVGEMAHFELQVENPSRRGRYSLGVSWPREPHAHSYADIDPQDSAVLALSKVAPRRGWLPAQVFSVFTEYPLGMFHAWTWMELDMACLVYPKPAPAGPPPPATRGHGSTLTGTQPGHDEFAGLRNYQRGDTPRSIHWKSFPKLRYPMVKQFTETLEQELWLDWESVPQQETEERLSQLTRWVLDAEAGQRPYGLRIPGLRIAPNRGEPHQDACLKALALFGTK